MIASSAPSTYYLRHRRDERDDQGDVINGRSRVRRRSRRKDGVRHARAVLRTVSAVREDEGENEGLAR